jgi:transcriptional regulator with XRE-family HTH domain
MIDHRQIRAARGLLGLSQQSLADAAKVAGAVVSRVERGVNDPRMSTMVAIKNVLEAAGIEFLAEPDGAIGVMLRPNTGGAHDQRPTDATKLAGTPRPAKRR